MDRVFADPATREGVTAEGAPVLHEAHRKEAKGRVEFWPVLSPVDVPEPDWWRPVDVESEAGPVARLAEQLALQIKRLDGRQDAPARP